MLCSWGMGVMSESREHMCNRTGDIASNQGIKERSKQNSWLHMVFINRIWRWPIHHHLPSQELLDGPCRSRSPWPRGDPQKKVAELQLLCCPALVVKLPGLGSQSTAEESLMCTKVVLSMQSLHVTSSGIPSSQDCHPKKKTNGTMCVSLHDSKKCVHQSHIVVLDIWCMIQRLFIGEVTFTKENMFLSLWRSLVKTFCHACSPSIQLMRKR